MGPVFVLALVFHPKGRWAGLNSPWPYLGAVMALLVFAPNLWWNANNDWMTLRFQMRHGLALERSEGTVEDRLPAPQITPKYGAEWSLAQPFRGLEKVTEREEKRPGPFAETLKALNRYVGYFAAQLVLWGAFALIIPVLWRQRRRGETGSAEGVLPELRPLLLAATWTPLVVVGLLSLKGKVEANWSAMYVCTTALFLTPLFAGSRRLLRIGVLCNVSLVVVAVLQARTGFLPIAPHKDRLLAEAFAYSQVC